MSFFAYFEYFVVSPFASSRFGCESSHFRLLKTCLPSTRLSAIQSSIKFEETMFSRAIRLLIALGLLLALNACRRRHPLRGPQQRPYHLPLHFFGHRRHQYPGRRVDAASSGDTVLVTNGIYKFGGPGGGFATNRLAITNSVTIQSVSGPSMTTIDGGKLMRCAFLTNRGHR